MIKLNDITVFYADGISDTRGESYLIEDVKLEADRVPVRLGFAASAPPLGWANLRWDGPRLAADMELNTDNIMVFGLYPAIGGTYYSEKQAGERRKIGVNFIALCSGKNCDIRIDSLKGGR